MRHINGVYTQFYNRKEQTDGPLFRGRYKAVLVDAQAYWSHLSRYIHRNPLDAGMVDRIEDYPWSSFPSYMDKSLAPEWLNTAYTLSEFGCRNQ
ncbi:MAG: putative transposase [Lentisphaeria bacterium]|jgi:putative transposase